MSGPPSRMGDSSQQSLGLRSYSAVGTLPHCLWLGPTSEGAAHRQSDEGGATGSSNTSLKSGGRGALPASGVAQTPAGRVPQAPRGPCWGSKLTREGPHRTRVRTRVRHPESWRRDEPPSRSAHPITGASTAHRRRLSGRHSLLAATRLFSGPFLPADRRARPPAGARARVAPGSVGRWGHRSRRGAGWSSKRGARGEAQPGVAVHSVAARHQGGLAVSVYKSINSSIANSPLPRGV